MTSPSISIFSSLAMRRGQGSASPQRPSKVALPGPSARKLGTAFCRSSDANSCRRISGVTSSAARPRRRDRRGRCAWWRAWAIVGPVGQPVGELHPLLEQLVVGDDAVDDAPALEHPRRRRGRRSSRTRAPARARRAPPSAGCRRRRASGRRPPRRGRTWPTRPPRSCRSPARPRGPAVRQRPWTRARVGISSASSRCTPADQRAEPCRARLRRPRRRRAGSASTSTPPVKMSPSARQTSARASEPSTSSRQRHERVEASSVNRLSGGLDEDDDGDVAVALEPDRRLGHRLSLPDRCGDCGDLVQVAPPRDPRQLQRIVLVAGDDVDVEVEDRLPGGGAAGIEQVEAVRLEASPPSAWPGAARRASSRSARRRRSRAGRRSARAGSPARGPASPG